MILPDMDRRSRPRRERTPILAYVAVFAASAAVGLPFAMLTGMSPF